MKFAFLKGSLFVFCFLLFVTVQAQSNKKIFENPKLKEIASLHKTVAILPYQVTIKMKKMPKNVTQEDINKQQKQEATNIQNSMYTFLLRKSSKYFVTFQDVAKTNALLAQNQITIENLDTFTKDQVAKILGVDAIISGSLITDKPVSEGGAMVVGFLTGFGMKTNEAKVMMSINNGTDGELLWRYDRQVAGGVGSSTDDLIDRIMRQIARNFPYDK